jgi:hypothetical protein
LRREDRSFQFNQILFAPAAFLARESSATNWLKGMMNAHQAEEGDGSTITPIVITNMTTPVRYLELFLCHHPSNHFIYTSIHNQPQACRG